MPKPLQCLLTSPGSRWRRIDYLRQWQHDSRKCVSSSTIHPPRATPARPLSRLPLSHVLRSYLIMGCSSSPILLKSITWTINKMLASRSRLFDPDRNPLLKWMFHKTFYSQFCAGENEAQVRATVADLHKIGFRGVVLEYASEVIDGEGAQSEAEATRTASEEISTWKDGLLTTVKMANSGDFVGLKWSGMGSSALRRLKDGLEPSEEMFRAMTTLCDAAEAKGVRLLPAAEPQYAQKQVDRWTSILAAEYNKTKPNHAVLYHTYQTYLKSSHLTLSQHLADASENGYTLGIKLVRGAYLDSETRSLIWDTKEQTDAAYDGITSELLTRRYGTWLQEPSLIDAAFPSINVVLATHNLESAEKARNLRDSQDQAQREACPLVYAQLAGMADEVSCRLLQAQEEAVGSNVDPPQTFKAAAWGSTKDCLNYLLRRAAENKDAVQRTRTTRQAMGKELRQRMLSIVR